MSVCWERDTTDTCNSFHKKFKKKNSFTINLNETVIEQPPPPHDNSYTSYTISGNPLFGPSMESSSGSNGSICSGSSKESCNAPRFSTSEYE